MSDNSNAGVIVTFSIGVSLVDGLKPLITKDLIWFVGFVCCFLIVVCCCWDFF